MKKIILLFILLFGLCLTFSCKSKGGETDKPIENPPEEKKQEEEKPKTYVKLSIYIDGEFYKDMDIEKSSKLDFNLEGDFIFLGWYDVDDLEYSIEGKTIRKDTSVAAKVIKFGTEYNINYHFTEDSHLRNGKTTETYRVGENKYLDDPVRKYDFEFTGWLLDGQVIKTIPNNIYGDIDLYDSWVDHNNYVNVTYVTGGDLTGSSAPLKEQIVVNEDYDIPYPIKDGWYFRGWYLDSSYTTRVYTLDGTKDETVYAKFERKTKANTYVSFLGDSITTYAGYIPSDAPDYYPSQYNMTVDQTYFMQVCKGMGYNFLVNNSYSGSKLTADVQSGVLLPKGTADSRIKGLSTDEHEPDIVIIHMGSNDYSQGVNAETFRTSLKLLCKKLHYYYDDVEIYICTHPMNGYPTGTKTLREAYNQVIFEEAEDSNYQVLDLTTLWDLMTWGDYIFASAHPNIAGFKKMADYIIAELKKTHNFN